MTTETPKRDETPKAEKKRKGLLGWLGFGGKDKDGGEDESRLLEGPEGSVPEKPATDTARAPAGGALADPAPTEAAIAEDVSPDEPDSGEVLNAGPKLGPEDLTPEPRPNRFTERMFKNAVDVPVDESGEAPSQLGAEEEAVQAAREEAEEEIRKTEAQDDVEVEVVASAPSFIPAAEDLDAEDDEEEDILAFRKQTENDTQTPVEPEEAAAAPAPAPEPEKAPEAPQEAVEPPSEPAPDPDLPQDDTPDKAEAVPEPVSTVAEATPAAPDPEPPVEAQADIPDTAPDPAPEAAPEPEKAPAEDPGRDAALAEEAVKERKKGFFARLKAGLSRSTNQLSEGITGIFTKSKLDDEALEDLEDLLITSDLGVEVAAEVTKELGSNRFDKSISPNEVREELARLVAKRLEPVAKPLELDPARKPHVILMVGVNGTGKTTTIGKLARQFTDEGKKVMLAAGDTFRAAAIDQLKVWGERTGTPVVSRDVGADSAGLAYDALTDARNAGCDVLMIDTAGRLQNKKDLMQELSKIERVLKKLDPDAPHSVLLVLDATTGQNAISQVEIFKETVGVTGLVMTKLDGTARGGILVSLASKFGLPIHAIGVGEAVEDFQPFEPLAFGRALTGADAD